MSYQMDVAEYVNDEPIYFDPVRDKHTLKTVFYRVWYLDNYYEFESLESAIEEISNEYDDDKERENE